MSDGPLRLACLDADAPPLFGLAASAQGGRQGFEPEVARLVADELGRTSSGCSCRVDMVPATQRGDADAVLCGQGITDLRREVE